MSGTKSSPKTDDTAREGVEMKAKARILACGLLAAVVAGAAGCPWREPMLRLLFNQGTPANSGGYSEFEYSDFFGGGQQLGDDFQLPEGRSTVSHITWRGAYRDNVPAEDDFSLLIYSDRGDGMPEVWNAMGLRVTELERADTGGHLTAGLDSLDVYQYGADVPSWPLEPDTTYFIVILNNTGRWIWCNNGSPEQGNDFGVSRDSFAGPWGSHGNDMTFQLWGYAE